MSLVDYAGQQEFPDGRYPRGSRDRLVWEINVRMLRGAEWIRADEADAIRDFPVSVNDAYILNLLTFEPSGRRSHSGLALDTFTSTSTMTNRIDRLEARGLVRRVSDPADRRTMLVELTPEGDELHLRMSAAFRAVHERWLEGFSDQELEAFSTAMCAMLEELERDKPRSAT